MVESPFVHRDTALSTKNVFFETDVNADMIDMIMIIYYDDVS